MNTDGEILAQVRVLYEYYQGTNRLFMREFDRSGHWSEAASESRRIEKMLGYALANQDPLQDDR